MKVVHSTYRTSHVCIVQSSSQLWDMLSHELEAQGYEVHALHSMQDAIAWLNQQKTCATIFIVDVTDENVNALQLLQMMRSRDASHIASIVVSASNEPVDLDRALAYGAEDYILKNDFSLEEIITKIRRAELHLSVEQTPMTTPSMPDLETFDTAATRVLIIEDDQFLRDLASRKLKQEGFQVDVAIDGTEGLAKLEQSKPDVVLLDIILPGLDGFDILKKVRANKNDTIRNTVIILLSNLGQEADVAKGQRLGADDYLIKANFTIDEIIEKIKIAVLGKRSKQ